MSETAESGAWDLRLWEETSSLSPSHLPQPPSWIAFMRDIDAEWRRYMQETDTPEDRLRGKNPERFRL
jgi:hypothetical protein